MSSSDGSIWNQSGSVSGLHTVGDGSGFGVTDLVSLVRSPKTEIVDRIKVDVLTVSLGRGGTVTLLTIVVSELTMFRVSLGWKVWNVFPLVISLDK